MIKALLLFAVGLVFLIKGGDWFVDGSVGLAHRFKMPEILIGATIVSIGTTLPEVMVSAQAAVGGHGEIAYGNAIGSVICNTSLIAALTIAIRPSGVDKKSLRTPVIFFFSAAAIYAFVAYVVKDFTRIVGIILLAVFVLYMTITIRQAFKNRGDEAVETDARNDAEPAEEMNPEKARKNYIKQAIEAFNGNHMGSFIIKLVIGAALIAGGANLLVNNGTIIAREFGVPESVIALTFVALGTSLPELVTAITALAKGHSSLSLGNIVGANLFNLVLVSGLSVTLSPFQVPASKLIGGLNASLVIDIPLMIAVMAIMTLPALRRGKLSRFQGIFLLAIYTYFVAFEFAL